MQANHDLSVLADGVDGASSVSSLRVFVGAGQFLPAKGNPCTLSCVESEPRADFIPEISLIDPGNAAYQISARSSIYTDAPVHCVTWPLAEAEFGVRCWTARGAVIQCCGHGLLAAASFWLSRHKLGQLTLQMNGSSIQCVTPASGEDSEQDTQLLWLSFTPLAVTPCPIPPWTERLFGSIPIAAAQAGDWRGYIILEWPQDYPLDTLPGPAALLQAATERALIVTAACGSGSGTQEEDIRFRYFAPQYGVDEDSATGSAMRVLASYWQQRRDIQQLTAYQCSPAGGLLYSRIENRRVLVGGRVARDPVTTIETTVMDVKAATLLAGASMVPEEKQ